MVAFFVTLFFLWSMVQAFQRKTHESIIEQCRTVTLPKSLQSNISNGNTCCKIMLGDLNSSEKGVLNYNLFKEAFTANGLPDPGKEQFGYFKLYGCKFGINSLNDSSMFLAPFIRALHFKLMIKYNCASRDHCKYKSDDASTLTPELWGWNTNAWANPSYSTIESGRFGGWVKYVLEHKGCKHLEEVLEIYWKIRRVFGFQNETSTYGCSKNDVDPGKTLLI